MNWLIAHWGGNKKDIFDRVVHSLEALGEHCTWIQRDGRSGRDRLLGAIRSGEYQQLLTWQRFYRMQTDILHALAESPIRTVFMDFGFIPHYESVAFDTKGDGAVSELRESWKRTRPAAASKPEGNVQRILVDAATRSRATGDHKFPERKHLRLPFVFLPLQRPGDSTVRFDSSVHDFRALVLKVYSLCAPAMLLVVKTHPMARDVDLGLPDQIPGRLLVFRRGFNQESEQLNDFLLSHAALVVGINSNMLLRAMLFGRPVISLGEGWFSGSGAYHDVAGLEALDVLAVPPIDHARRRRVLQVALERQVGLARLNEPLEVARVLRAIGVPLASAPKIWIARIGRIVR